jgi:flagellar protein FlbT
MNISLRRGEKIYVNGAVFRVDRRVCIELLNDVTFLLENHVMQVDEATTPLKQLYFVIQTMLMAPRNAPATMAAYRSMSLSLNEAVADRRLADGLVTVAEHMEGERLFDALKTIRSLFPIESEVIGLGAPSLTDKKVA